MITILLQKILAALTQLLGDIKTKLNTIKDNLDELIVVATASGPIASFTTTITKPFISFIVDIPESESGTDTVIITQLGKNLADASIVYPEYPEVTEDGKTCRKVTCGSSKTVSLKIFKPNTQYTIKMSAKCVTNGTPTVDSRGFVFFYSDNTQSYINFGKVSADWADYTATSTSGKTVVAVGTFTSDWRLNIFVDNSKFMIVESTTANDYIPYSATTKTVSLPSTVYGGEVDITDLITPEIKAINGVNNIFSDSGDVTVEYLKLYKED